MLDNPEKTMKLLAALKAVVPFEVELTERLIKQLQAQHDAVADQKHHTVANLSYAGDETEQARAALNRDTPRCLTPSL